MSNVWNLPDAQVPVSHHNSHIRASQSSPEAQTEGGAGGICPTVHCLSASALEEKEFPSFTYNSLRLETRFQDPDTRLFHSAAWPRKAETFRKIIKRISYNSFPLCGKTSDCFPPPPTRSILILLNRIVAKVRLQQPSARLSFTAF